MVEALGGGDAIRDKAPLAGASPQQVCEGCHVAEVLAQGARRRAWRRGVKWTKSLPEKLPARVHEDFGNDLSWSGELRAVVDDDQLVIRKYSPGRGWRYFIETRWCWEQGTLKPGPLPRRPTP